MRTNSAVVLCKPLYDIKRYRNHGIHWLQVDVHALQAWKTA